MDKLPPEPPEHLPSILDDQEWGPIIRRRAEEFGTEIAQEKWRLNKHDPKSPFIDKSIRQLMVDGFLDIVESLERAQQLQKIPRKRYLVSLTRDGAALNLESALRENPVIQAYARNAELKVDGERAVQHLLGSTVKRAISMAQEMGIRAPQIRFKHFDFPEVTYDEFTRGR